MSIEERDRIAELRDALDRTMNRRGIASHRELVQVYDGGSIPTTVPKMFLSRPVGIDVDETEGATPSIVPDTTQSIPVLVLGPRVPAAGDNLLARVIGGRWVAGMQGGASDCVPCGECCVPKTNLIMSDSTGPGTLTLTWDGASAWTYADDFDTFTLTCSLAGPSMTHTQEEGALFEGLTFDEWTCDPFHAEFHSIEGVHYFIDAP